MTSEPTRPGRREPERREPEPATEEGRQALESLRGIWAATGQMDTEQLGLECADDERGCSANVNFDAFADTVEPTTDTAEALERLRRAWKATLAREGKLRGGSGLDSEEC
ncbi:MAG TPA: hypothetical protein VJS45_15990 [Acidimicrobiia bacterium]|nr:hypothetical protein [Acidimicrobiia bacterium]